MSAGNTIGQLYRLTSFGESHGPAIGGVIDGMPAGIAIDLERIQQELDKRRPGSSAMVTPRQEADRLHILSGIFEGKTTGTPIGFMVENTNPHSSDYAELRHVFRPNHGDYTYTAKYGVRDYRGGGRASARETIARVVAGAFALQVLEQHNITIDAWLESVGTVKCRVAGEISEQMQEEISRVRSRGDSVGGMVSCIVHGCPAGLGEPVFDKLHARLAYAMMGINAAKGFEYGRGMEAAQMLGSEMVDNWQPDANDPRGISTRTNNSGGIQAGISNGEDITMRIAFKPTPTLLRNLETVDDRGNATVLHARGRHDPCVAVRAVPVVRAMAAMTILDFLLLNQSTRPS